ncbi:MAG: peptidyl-prolyl cis-trans isomerase [Cellvibrionaceae bacterium]|nr:peptidyl-prolyl cis-trans isomerase [Cellvibrionaceae bacterium]
MNRFFVTLLLSFPLLAYGEVILEKNGITITTDDVERYIETRLPENDRLRIVARPGFFKETVENIYGIRLLAEQGRKNSRLDVKLIDWASQMEIDRIYMKAQMQDLTVQKFEKVDWESRALELYTAEKERFRKEESVEAAHVLIKEVGRSSEEAKALAESIRSKALNGAEFAKLATEYSEDKSVERNQGSLGEFERGRMVKEFEDAVFSLNEPGSISSVTKSQFGYHVIKLIAKNPAQKLPFEEVKGQIIDELKAADEKMVLGNLITGTRTDAATGIKKGSMDKLIAKYAEIIEGSKDN